MELSEKERADQNEWDIYWDRQTTSSNKLYDRIAYYYRKWILSKFLKYYVKKYFSPNKKVLHAGCGGGQVDEYIKNYIEVIPLDISSLALKKYIRNNGPESKVVLGSIFNLPFSNNAFNGIYNLGVMEHFSEEEILQILSEFNRVLVPGGSLLLFWPPTFGLSVFVLDSAHFILNRLFGKSIQLHPAEITRIKSRSHARQLMEKAGLINFQYHFGYRDIFSQLVIYCQKTVAE